MCRNRLKEIKKPGEWEEGKYFFRCFLILSFSCLFLFCFLFRDAVYAEQLKVSIVPGDTHSKTAVEAIKTVRNQLPAAKDILFKVYPSKDIRNRNLTHLKESKLVIIQIMGRQLIDTVHPEIEEVIKNGGIVYAFGGTYDDDHREMGILVDENIIEYYRHGGTENFKNMVLYALKKDFGLDVSYGEVVSLPEFGIYGRSAKRIFDNFEEYKSAYAPYRENRPWVGIVFYKNTFESGQTNSLDAVIKKFEQNGFNVLPVYGSPAETSVERFFFDEKGNSRVRAVVGMSLKVGLNPQIAIPLFNRLNVPVINAITLYGQSEDEWRKSRVGLDIFERTWQLTLPELGGIIQPTVIASKEKVTDKDSGIEYIEERPVPERINRLVERVKAWVNLQEKQNKDKNIAIIYYNYPPGKQNIGASYLNVLPESLWEILNRLKQEGYDVGETEYWTKKEFAKERLFDDIHNYARNIGNWASGEIDRLVKSGRPVLIPIDIYKKWFDELPDGFKNSVVRDWGEPENGSIMTWEGANGTKYIVIPVVKYGNILFTPQPSRGWEQDTEKLYHDVSISPHHQYVAFYLWLKNEFQADAIAHIGTHGTHEWLSGKEAGFTEDDPPEALIQDLPNIYPYIVDNVGEGLQAKRRGMAVIIDHMTPPFDKAGMNKELRELRALINDYNVSKDKSQYLAEVKLSEINKQARKTGILTDLKLRHIETEDEIEELEHYIKEIAEKQTPFGLHTFGKLPEEKYRKSTAEAILSLERTDKSPQNVIATSEETAQSQNDIPDSSFVHNEDVRKKEISEIEQRIIRSARRELDSFAAALDGGYIPAGQGNDPIRNPDSLPTGKNFYSVDSRRIPSKGVYESGVKLAKELIEGYKQRHGIYPDKLTFNVWGVETIRHEGVMESQIMYLMGIKPGWDERGRVIGVEAIPGKEIGRARIDVTVAPSGLYRDLFPDLMALLDKAVSLAKEQDEEDNILRANVIKTKKMLTEKGMDEDKAERLASVRLFTQPSGAYGTNLDKVIPLSDTWDDEKQVADVYFMRMSHLYGQGFWGDKVEGIEDREQMDISLVLFKNALSGSKIAVHSRSGNLYATLDNDDFFQYLGGTAMAIRAVDGKTPEVYVTNMSNPAMPRQETLEKFMGREMRSRYLNPEWIKAMMKEGYAGARFIDTVVEHLWGWQVTVPEAVDAAKWNEMYETHVLDRNGLNIKEMFRQAKNAWAYQSIVARMLETIRKNYWKADKEVVETLAKEYAESVKEVGLACSSLTCNNLLLAEFTADVLTSVPALKSQAQEFRDALDKMRNPEHPGNIAEQKEQPADERFASAPDDGTDKTVEGYEMQDVSMISDLSYAPAPVPYLFLIGFLTFAGLIVWGFRRRIGQ
ncbi:MAG: cobaltochelatase subunit CobN [Candidatus Loosdrechtia sp.]|uniref:cobaltochelatase subunit CobN n=1 Tax=Candidatus Loosdrechtia sp. TaxID=3101272 RepID=UPI003A5E1296|nr:MAG: cobaltochelatase subunit CobN [Candidatus Jettenia sp. AMX2]